MDATARIERSLEAAIERATAFQAPPKLSDALRYSVFPGGARVRPQLCLAVAEACGGDAPAVADSAAAAIELLHCASLVHDDLPCFDNADIRRGKPSVHKIFGESQAVLAGDALIVLAFETLTYGTGLHPQRLPGLLMTIARSTGMPMGIVAGQAWESEPSVGLRDYHRAKTGALFAASTAAGALASGRSPDQWRPLGERIGEAYQVADDIQDMISNADKLGKPCGQDVAHHRPSATSELGLDGAVKRIRQLIGEAIDSIPECRGADDLRGLIAAQATRFVPKELARYAA